MNIFLTVFASTSLIIFYVGLFWILPINLPVVDGWLGNVLLFHGLILAVASLAIWISWSIYYLVGV